MYSTNSPYMFASAQAAHNELMTVAAEVIREIVQSGIKPPSPSRMLRDVDRLWAQVYRHLAPR